MTISARVQRQELVGLARQPGANVRQLCRQYGVSAKTAYKWIARAASGEEQWASDRSRRPGNSPRQTPAAIERVLLEAAEEFASWGPRKILRVLQDRGYRQLPAVSTVAAIFRRNGRPRIPGSKLRATYQRFEQAAPNELWQMDFKQGFAVLTGSCFPLTILDDHSRFGLCVQACANQRIDSVQPALIQTFRRYGLPRRLLMDNGSCWGVASSRYTQLGAWLIRLGIGITHGRFYHPQTQGKNERFNRTLKLEALRGRQFTTLQDCQRALDAFCDQYNYVRPHQALDLQTPASRYQPSSLPYPEVLPPIEYPQGDLIRHVGSAGVISFHNTFYQVGRAFTGQPVGLRPTRDDAQFTVFYCHHPIARIDVRQQTCTPY